MAVGILAVAVVGLVVVVVYQALELSRMQKAQLSAMTTLEKIAAVEHGVNLDPPPDWEQVVKEHVDIYGMPPEFTTARHEREDDASLRQDPEQLGAWDVPPGMMDSPGDDEMT